MEKYVYEVSGMTCHSCEVLIKERLSQLPGVKFADASTRRGDAYIEYEGVRPTQESLNELFKEEKFTFCDFVPVSVSADPEDEPITEPAANLVEHSGQKITVDPVVVLGEASQEKKGLEGEPVGKNIKEHIYKIEGMHCASCEILIEKKLLQLPNIKAVDASTSKGEVVVEYEGDRPNPERLNKIFKEENYKFSDSSIKPGKAKEKTEEKPVKSSTLVAFNIAIFIIIAFLILNKAGIANFLSLNSTSSLATFFGFGLLAGISSCAALVGGIVLSMSKQWQGLYAPDSSTSKKLQPHLMFNFGRIASYGFFGAVLGIIGSRLQISPQFTSYMIVAISFLMVALGLQMLGIKAFRKFQLAAPKSATRYVANENNFQGKYMPFLMGAATFILPCGFTITAQGLALISGNWFQGGLIMASFALGTAPMLLFIGLSSIKFSAKPHLAARFSKVAGFLVLFFAMFNISNQVNVLGFTGLSLPSGNNSVQTAKVDLSDLPQIIDGKQVIKMIASGDADSPNYFKVRTGVPVRWEITASNSPGCNGAIISNSLFSGTVNLTPGQMVAKEFTPQKAGKYRFSCTMGMVTGIIEVVDVQTANDNNGVQTVSAAEVPGATADISASTNDGVVPSGATGCGCGGGGSGISCGG